MKSGLLAALLASALVVWGPASAGPAQMPSAPNPYRAVDTWPQLPAGMELGQVSGVELDARGNVWVIHRADPPILEFDASGKLLKSFGSGMFVQAHSLHFDRDGNLWAVDGDGRDGKGNQVVKLDPSDGHVLLTLPGMFNRPADVVTSANGDVFVADGHVNSRIVKFSKDGRFLMSWGTKGSGPGELNTPHSIAIDSKGRVLVGDRGNNRIELFDQNGRYLAEWKQFGRPTGLFVASDDTVYVADDESNAERNPGWMPGIRVGSAAEGSVKAIIPAMSTERAVADGAGNIYAAVLAGRTVRKYVK
jgi:DNA-binding beta-propeller fold protein YncE